MALDSSLCCLCLKTSDFLLNIFEEQSVDKSLALIISQHFWFDIKKEENISKSVCVECWSNVDNFHSFYTHVYTVHNEFYSRVHEEIKPKIDEAVVVDAQPLPNILDPEIKLTIKSEREVDIESETTTACNLEKIDLPPAELNEIEDDEISEDSFKMDDAQNDDSVGDSSDSDASIVQPKTKILRKKKRKPRVIDPAQLAKTEEENKHIRERFPMECEQCDFHFDTFNDAQIHYRTVHKTKGYLRCCDTKFKTRPTVVEHFNRHLNPDEFKCDQCNKTFVSKRGLSEHMDRHLSTEDKPFKCTECPKSYIRRFLLERHMESHKDLPKCICDDCGKAYSNKLNLNIHKRNVHDRAFIHICDVCAKEFRNKVDFDQHHRNVHETVPQPKVQCTVCGAWLKTKQYLRQHMVRHQDVKVMHPCGECDKSFPYRRALRNHIRTVHPKKMYDCYLCDKQFKKPVSLKEHMATHTGVSLYQCPHCPKTFNSSANMYSHRKKVHKTEREAQLKLKAAGLA